MTREAKMKENQRWATRLAGRVAVIEWLNWATWRRLVQYLALFLFLYLLIGTLRGGWTFLPMDLFVRLDPLVALSTAIAGRAWVANLTLAALTVAATLALGRVWCGWLCPLGTVLDLVNVRRVRGGDTDPSSRWRKMKYFLLFTLLVAALGTNLSLMVLDPVTIMIRTLTTVALPGLNWAVTAAEMGLYRFSFLQRPLEWIEATFRGNLLPSQQPFYQLNILLVLFLAGILALNAVRRRFWCRYLCPLGALLGLVSKVAWVKRQVAESCNQCRRCARECPTGTIDPERGFASDPGECIVCLSCQEVCPQGAVAFKGGLGPLEWRSYDPSRRQLLGSLGLGLAGVALLRTGPAAWRENLWLIRPPGARGKDFLARCIRCGECMRICPTFGLQPSLSESGWEGLWTPVLVPRLGYCDYSCHSCGQVCPTGAIPELTLEEKRKEVIGLAYIDENRCIPWADNRNCIVCEEMCPLPEKAIRLDEVEVVNEEGEIVVVKRPRVLRDLCIGCGICEHKCPLNGEAAIRVRVPNEFAYEELAW